LTRRKIIFFDVFYFVTIVANKIDKLDFCGICKKKFLQPFLIPILKDKIDVFVTKKKKSVLLRQQKSIFSLRSASQMQNLLVKNVTLFILIKQSTQVLPLKWLANANIANIVQSFRQTTCLKV
jgi:hypothetical protein